MEITKEQIRELTKIAQAIDAENRIDDDVTGGYVEEPYNSIIERIYAVVNECEGKEVDTGENNALLPDVSRWACCGDCKHFKHDILEDEDVTRCEKFEIDIDSNIYEKTQCSWFQPCG